MYVILVCSHVLNYYLGFILCSFFIIPIFSSFLGTKVFKDSSCYDGDDIILGYPPIYPWISLLIGICSFFYIMKFNNSVMPIACLTFIIQLIVVLPHIQIKYSHLKLEQKRMHILHYPYNNSLYCSDVLNIGQWIIKST